jgi:hypothetical protein
MIAAQQLTEPSEVDLAEYVSLASAAVQLGQADPEALGVAAHIIALLAATWLRPLRSLIGHFP